MEEEKIYFNALNLILGENYSQFSHLYQQVGSFKLIWQELPSEIKKEVNPFQEWKKLKDSKIKLTLLSDSDFPPLLREIPAPPLGLYYKGNILSPGPTIALVGTRKASSYGKTITQKITKALIEYNFIIISGLAYGIDSIAHQTTVENQGITWAVLGSGLDKVFPSLNKKLAQKITQKGALLSEYPLGTPPLKHHFPRRNRIISGLSLGTVVIEAPRKSGALITASYAIEQNREVFAFPGSIFDANFQGNHHLIQEGAKLVQTVEDILEEFNIPLKRKTSSSVELTFSNPEEKAIYQALSFNKPLTIDKIKEKVNLKTNQILAILSSLELQGLVEETPEGKYLKRQ